jgi:integrase
MPRKKLNRLTDADIAALKPKHGQRYPYADSDQRGLYIRVSPSGVKAFYATARAPRTLAGAKRKQKWVPLGRHPEVTIEEAREKAKEVIKRIEAGQPAVEPEPVKPDTLGEVAEGWLKRYVVEKKKLRTEKDIRRRLTRFVKPTTLWDRPFVSIKRGDFASLLDDIEDGYGTRQADQTLTDLRSMATWYATRNGDYLPPFIRGMKRGVETSRERTLNDEEIRTIWQAAGDAGRFGAIVKLALLLGQRRDKLITMQREHIRAGAWHVPHEDREKPNGGSLVLPKLAVEIIEAQGQLESNSKWVFPGYRGTGHIAGIGMFKQAFDKRLAALGWDKIVRIDAKGRPIEPGWTLHDLRRTARSLMSRKETGISRDTAERVLGHVIGSKVERTYDRDEYVEAKAEALAALARLVERIVSPPPADDDKVVELAQHRA